ncbi:hypothetical protein V865_001879 [Kwoniella europaea PYCC6329]|uniref:BRCT domain-containing protein n=1 Tax=Kwoniella europaea PYCC6329 TaxID=1423913 RepID=A0AAX4KCY2_9TREE
MSNTYYPPGFKPPVLEVFEHDAPPMDKEGKKLFEGEKFHVIPNDKEKERIGEGHGLDIFEKVKGFITDRAGGTLVTLEEASYILIRHPDIKQFAKTLDSVCARRLIHFDWVMDSLIVRQRVSKDRYWGTPREKEKAEKHHAQGSDLTSQNIPRDPRKHQAIRNPGENQVQHDSKSMNYFASSSSSNSQFHTPRGESPWSEARRASESYRAVSGYSEPIIPTMRRSSYDIPRQVSNCFAGIGFYVSGPIPAKRNIERKIKECDGTPCDNIQQASKVIVVDPRFLFGFKDGNLGITVYGKKQLFGDFEVSTRAGKIILTEGFIHDCHYKRRMLNEKEYMVEKEDLEDFQCWGRTKDGNLLRSRQNPNFSVCGRWEEATSVSSESQRDISRVYATPESPERLVANQPVKSPTNTLSFEDASVTSDSKDLNNVQADVDKEKSSLAIDHSLLHPHPATTEYEDDDFDVCCTDSESKSLETEGEFRNFDSRSSSPLSTIGDGGDNNVEEDPTYTEASRAGRKRKVKVIGISNLTKRDSKWHKIQHDAVHPCDQEKYERLIHILKAQIKKSGSLPKGGIRAFTACHGLQSVYRRYASLVRRAVPGLPEGGGAGRPRKTKLNP